MAEEFLDVADLGDGLLEEIVAGVAHVDAEDVGAGARQLLDRLLVVGGGSERGDDLDPAQASHGVPSVTSGSGPPSIGASSPGGRVALEHDGLVGNVFARPSSVFGVGQLQHPVAAVLRIDLEEAGALIAAGEAVLVAEDGEGLIGGADEKVAVPGAAADVVGREDVEVARELAEVALEHRGALAGWRDPPAFGLPAVGHAVAERDEIWLPVWLQTRKSARAGAVPMSGRPTNAQSKAKASRRLGNRAGNQGKRSFRCAHRVQSSVNR